MAESGAETAESNAEVEDDGAGESGPISSGGSEVCYRAGQIGESGSMFSGASGV